MKHKRNYQLKPSKTYCWCASRPFQKRYFRSKKAALNGFDPPNTDIFDDAYLLLSIAKRHPITVVYKVHDRKMHQLKEALI